MKWFWRVLWSLIILNKINMKFYFITTITFLLFSCNKTINKEEKKKNTYLQKSIEFIKLINKNEFENKKIILVDKPFDFEDFDCIESVLNPDYALKIYSKLKLLQK